MHATDLTPDLLAQALARTAAGLYPHEAAVRLLVEHGHWPARLAGADLVILDDDAEQDTSEQRYQQRYARVDWQGAVAALDAGDLYASGSEARVLQIAASLGGGVAVDLADGVSGLDRSTLALVLAALSHANGSHEHHEYVVERSADGHPPVVTVGTPRMELGPVYTWPGER